MSRDEPYNAAERDDVKAASKVARQEQIEDEDIYRQIISTPQGRKWMHKRLGNCCVFQPTFTGEALQSAYLEGQRNIGLLFLNEIARLCPDLFIHMLREANDRAIIADTVANRNAKPEPDDPADVFARNAVDYSTAGDEPA